MAKKNPVVRWIVNVVDDYTRMMETGIPPVNPWTHPVTVNVVMVGNVIRAYPGDRLDTMVN